MITLHSCILPHHLHHVHSSGRILVEKQHGGAAATREWWWRCHRVRVAGAWLDRLRAHGVPTLSVGELLLLLLLKFLEILLGVRADLNNRPARNLQQKQKGKKLISVGENKRKRKIKFAYHFGDFFPFLAVCRKSLEEQGVFCCAPSACITNPSGAR